jgi:hypothetical protein
MTIRRSGLPQFVAACLISGYVWLGVGGAVVLSNEPLFAGFSYDAYLHAVLLGFVFSMVFGHAPIIFPAVIGRPIGFTPFAYVPLAVLHFSVALRILADLAEIGMVRQAAGVWTGVAVVLYGAFIVYGLLRGDSRSWDSR